MIIKGKNKRTIKETMKAIGEMKLIFKRMLSFASLYAEECLPITEEAVEKEKRKALKEAEENGDDIESINNDNIIKSVLAVLIMADCGLPLNMSLVADIIENTMLITKEYMDNNPYFRKIKLNSISAGNVEIAEGTYRKWEIIPLTTGFIDGGINAGRWGIIAEEITFPELVINEHVWMSISPNEIETMKDAIDAAHGKTLALGLGMGYFAYMAHLKEDVECVTIVEKDNDVISIFKDYILPQFDYPEKIKIIHMDAYEYLDSLHGGEHDFCFADIWLKCSDGFQHYLKLIPYEIKLGMQFMYWIEDAFLGHLSNTVAAWILLEWDGKADDLKNTTNGLLTKTVCQITEDLVLSTSDDIYDAIRVENIKKMLYKYIGKADVKKHSAGY